MKWLPRDPYHQVSECGTWIINKTGGPNPIYMLVRKPAEIVKVGTLQQCRDAAIEPRESSNPPATR